MTKRLVAALAARRRITGAGDTPDGALSTFTNGTWDVDADGSTTATLTYTAKNSAANGIPGLPVTFAVARTFISASNGVVTAEPEEIADDDATTSTITVYARDTSDIPVVGLPAASNVIAATGTGNTVTQPAAATDYLGRATGTLRSSVAATKTVSVTQADLAITDTASVDVTGDAPSGPDPAFAAYNNSSEVPNASGDSNEIFTDDFYRAFGVKGNAEGKAGPSNATTVFSGSVTASGNVQYTAGLAGTIYHETPYPAGTPVGTGRGGAINAHLGTYVYSSGSSGEATQYSYTKAIKTSSSSGVYRLDMHFSADFLFGATKLIDLIHPGADSGITWGDIHVNLGSGAATTGVLAFQGVGAGNFTGLYTFQRNHWYSLFFQFDFLNDILRLWVADNGTDGTAGSIVNVLDRDDYGWTPANGYSGDLLGVIKINGYSNPGSEGQWKHTNHRFLLVGEVGVDLVVRDD